MSEAGEQKLRAYLERATGALKQTKQKLDQLEARQHEPIAVIGMACRFPGGVHTPRQLWALLDEGRDAITSFPEDRGWDLRRLYDTNRNQPGTTYTEGGGFLDHPGEFDAEFFGVSPREAASVDPQHRLLLELSWEVLERAGVVPGSLYESTAGVFVGLCYDDYLGLVPPARLASDGYSTLGNLYSVASGRIAYTLGLQGPAVTVDTACSTSLVTVHLACQSLRLGECALALAGGATTFSTPDPLISFSRLKTLAPDGRCKSFSAQADGAGWAEGAGMLALERLSDAQRNNRRILAVIRGSAINQDGRSQGLTAPNGPSQQRVIRAALADAQLTPADVDVIEAHGTGTALGDPIEAHAIMATYGRMHDADNPVWLGSIKSNIGHTQAAAGVAGIMKLILAMQHQRIPKTLHADPPSEEIEWDASHVNLVQTSQPWPADAHPRRGAVSAFGISGTNAHVIVEQPPVSEPAPREPRSPAPVPLLLSAKSPAALRDQARLLCRHLADNPELELADVGFSLTSTRTAFEHRAACVASTREQVVHALETLAEGESSSATVIGKVADHGGDLVFVFPGQGSQWADMAVALLDASPTFRASILACEDALRPHQSWSLTAALRGELDPDTLGRVDVIQPVLFAMMVSLAAVWRAHGIYPDAVIGHSQGEIAAACVAGALSLEDAAKVVALRSQAITTLIGKGAMAAVMAPREALLAQLEPFGDQLEIAVDNGPNSAVVSGTPEAIDEFVAKLDAAKLFARKVKVSYASHCAQIEDIEELLLDKLRTVEPREAAIRMYSTVDAKLLAGPELDAAYWYRNLRQTVRFSEVVDLAFADGHRHFVEVSPHPVAAVSLDALLDQRGYSASVVPTLRRNEGGLDRFLLALAQLHVGGYPIDWRERFGEPAPQPVELPTYSFQRQTHWITPAKSTDDSRPPTSSIDDEFWRRVLANDIDELAQMLALDDGEASQLASVLPRLATWGRARQLADTTAHCHYRTRWIAATVPGSGPTGGWLIVSPDGDAAGELGRRLAEHMRAAGLTVGLETFDPASTSEDFAARLRTSLDGASIDGVVSTLAGSQRRELDGDLVGTGIALNLALAQALSDLPSAVPTWFVTSGAVAASDGDRVAAPEQATTWGFARVFSLEHPDRWGGLIDLPETVEDAQLDLLVALLGADNPEDQLAVRDADVFARRVVHAPATSLAPTELELRGPALITGGLGAIGRHFARFLAKAGTEHIILTSRRGPDSPEAAAVTGELEQLGARVTIAACDVGVRSDVEQLFAQLAERGDSPRAIFHSAGVLDDAPITTLTLERTARVFHPKAAGAVLLDELTAELELDHFVLFSSFAGAVGNAGQGCYAAANAMLEALAEQRRARGAPGCAVSWGPWAGGGMADDEVLARLDRRGLRPLEPELAVDLFFHVAHDSNFLIVDTDWVRFAPSYAPRLRPLFAELPEARAAFEADEDPLSQGDLAEELRELAPEARRERILSMVLRQTAGVLGHRDGSALDPEAGFSDLGLDSLMAVELRQLLHEQTRLTLPATLAFDFPTPLDVSEHLLERLTIELELDRDGPATEPDDALADDELDQLADDDLIGMAEALLGEVD